MMHSMTRPKLASSACGLIFVRHWTRRLHQVMIKAAKDVRAAKFMHERHPMLGVMGGWGDGTGSLDTTKNTSQNKRHVYMYTYMYVYIYIHIIVWENMQA